MNNKNAHRSNTFTPLLIAVAAFAACPNPAALAQNALGDGRALDANQQLNASRFNPRGHDVMDQIRFQNSIVTGNAPRGLSFRGDVGYTAAGDFRASLGSNDLFSFSRDAAFTNPADSIRGTDALRYQFALTTGSAPPSILGLSSFTIDRRGGATSTLAPDVERAARALRSTTDYLSEKLAAPTILGYQADESGRNFVVVASPLTGIRASEIPRSFTVSEPQTTPQTETPDLSARNRAIRGMPLSGLEARASNAMPIFDFGQRLDTRQTAQMLAPASQAHSDILDRIAERIAAQDPSSQDPTRQDPSRQDATQAGDLQSRLSALTQRLLPSDQQTQQPTQQPETSPPATDIATQAAELLEAIRTSGFRVNDLAPRATADDPLFRRHMSDGQRLLAAARYFDAEDSFVRALSVKPRDPMASAGRIHAQLGAGLYLSASLNLRLLIANHPELATLRFDTKLLPATDRIPTLIAELRNQIDTSLSPGVPRDAALLLAYMGFQTDRTDHIRLGLNVYAELARAQPDKDLADFLKTVWLAPLPEER